MKVRETYYLQLAPVMPLQEIKAIPRDVVTTQPADRIKVEAIQRVWEYLNSRKYHHVQAENGQAMLVKVDSIIAVEVEVSE